MAIWFITPFGLFPTPFGPPSALDFLMFCLLLSANFCILDCFEKDFSFQTNQIEMYLSMLTDVCLKHF